MTKMAKIVGAAALILALGACSNPADVVSANLSNAADNFQINRRIVFYNGITGEYMLTIEGLCSLGNYDKTSELTVTCQTGPGQYKKDFLGLSDNVTFFSEQMDPVAANTFNYVVTFKPSTLLPDIHVQ